MSDDTTSDYTVGYKKPARHTQFKPGKSGNPKGRPRKNATLEETLTKELLASICVAQGGRRRRTSVLGAIIKLFIHATMKGDLKAGALLLNRFASLKQTELDNLAELLQQFRTRNAQLATDES
ncbi:MAG: DUF5681 domain-containing protein [Candidatus Korobacteraceae bacterium]